MTYESTEGWFEFPHDNHKKHDHDEGKGPRRGRDRKEERAFSNDDRDDRRGRGRGGRVGRDGHGRGGYGNWQEGPFGPGGFGPGFGRPQPPRRNRGDVKAAVLLLLSERPMHGYEIITDIVDRSEGTWRVSPGSVYPVLKMLTKKGLVEPQETGGKKVFHLTDAGSGYVDKHRDEWGEPWTNEETEQQDMSRLWQEAKQLAMAVWQVAQSGDESLQDTTGDALAKARKTIFMALADDVTQPTREDESADRDQPTTGEDNSSAVNAE